MIYIAQRQDELHAAKHGCDFALSYKDTSRSTHVSKHMQSNSANQSSASLQGQPEKC